MSAERQGCQGQFWAHGAEKKEWVKDGLSTRLQHTSITWGHLQVTLKTGPAHAITELAVKERRALHSTMLENPDGEASARNGVAEKAVQEVEGQSRTMRSALMARIEEVSDWKTPLHAHLWTQRCWSTDGVWVKRSGLSGRKELGQACLDVGAGRMPYLMGNEVWQARCRISGRLRHFDCTEDGSRSDATAVISVCGFPWKPESGVRKSRCRRQREELECSYWIDLRSGRQKKRMVCADCTRPGQTWPTAEARGVPLMKSGGFLTLTRHAGNAQVY